VLGLSFDQLTRVEIKNWGQISVFSNIGMNCDLTPVFSLYDLEQLIDRLEHVIQWLADIDAVRRS